LLKNMTMTKTKGWTRHYRDDKGNWEDVCVHGIGHEKGMHGCDGCCSELYHQAPPEKSHLEKMIRANVKVTKFDEFLKSLSNFNETFYLLSMRNKFKVIIKSIFNPYKMQEEQNRIQNSGRKLFQEGQKAERELIRNNIGFLRQWLNERTQKESERLVTNKDIETWLFPEGNYDKTK
jgi:hypothetical protein